MVDFDELGKDQDFVLAELFNWEFGIEVDPLVGIDAVLKSDLLNLILRYHQDLALLLEVEVGEHFAVFESSHIQLRFTIHRKMLFLLPIMWLN